MGIVMLQRRERPGQPATEVVVVRAPACHLCEDAIDVLTALSSEFPIRVRIVELDSPAGGDLVRTHSPALFPAVVVNGTLFSQGRLPRRKLRRFLEGRP